MKKYIVIKVIIKVESYDIEYGKMFDSEIDAIRAAVELNEAAKENGFDVRFMVLPEGAE